MASDPADATQEGPLFRAFGRDVGISIVGTGLVLLLAFGNNVAVARLGGPEARGLYALGVAALALAWPVASLGLPGAVVFLLGRGRDEREIVGLSALLVAILAGACGLALGALVVHSGMPSGRGLAFFATAVVLPASVAFELIRSRFLGQRRALAFNGSLAGLTALLLGLNLVTLPLGDLYVLINWAISFWVVASCLVAFRLARGPRPRWPSLALRREARHFGLRAAGVRLTEAALMRIDYLAIAPWLSLEALGIYAIADQLGLLLASVGLQTGRMMFAHSAADPTGEHARAILLRSLAILAAFTALIVVLAAATFDWLIPAVFSNEFAGAYEPLLLLLPGTVFRSFHAPVAAYLRGQGRQDPIVVAGIVATISLVAGALLVAPTGQIWAVAAAKSGALALQLAIVLVAYRWARRRDTIQTS